MSFFKNESYPLLSELVRVEQFSDGKIHLHLEDEILETNEDTAWLIKESFPYFNGLHSISEVADKINVESDSLISLIETLSSKDLIIDTREIRSSIHDGKAFQKAVHKECNFWSKEINALPLMTTILEGKASPHLLYGWGIEFTHYVDGANEYMPAGVTYCREDDDTREILSKQYCEEAYHGKIFLKGLVDCGFDRDQLLEAPPLASTRALLNFLTEVATESTLAYTICFALMQPEGEDLSKKGLEDFYGDLSKRYPYAKKMFESFKKHALLDVELGHEETLFEKLYKDKNNFSEEDALRAEFTIRTLTQHFKLFFRGIEEYYSTETPQIPRKKSRVASFLSEGI